MKNQILKNPIINGAPDPADAYNLILSSPHGTIPYRVDICLTSHEDQHGTAKETGA